MLTRIAWESCHSIGYTSFSTDASSITLTKYNIQCTSMLRSQLLTQPLTPNNEASTLQNWLEELNPFGIYFNTRQLNLFSQNWFGK